MHQRSNSKGRGAATRIRRQKGATMKDEHKIMSKMVCYCFNYSETDIEQDVRNNNGQSTILEKIKTAKQMDSCRCKETNPSGK